jgi:hypothetical protein
MYPSKNVNLCLFYALEWAIAWKMWANSIDHLSRPPHFRPHSGWGLGGSGSGGEAAKYGESLFTAKTSLFIRQLSAS